MTLQNKTLQNKNKKIQFLKFNHQTNKKQRMNE